MSGKIIGAFAAAIAVAYICDKLVSDAKIFGGTTPKTIANKEWQQATDQMKQAWPRVAGPPVVLNPISRQNFVIKSSRT